MTEERDTEQAGAPIDETGVTDVDVQAAVDRAIEPVEEPETVVTAVDPDHNGAQVHADAPVVSNYDMPSAAAAEVVVVEPAAEAVAPVVVVEQPDEKIAIASDHPMAGFYVQSALPPEPRGNRGAGVLIALVATVAFALVYAGAIAAWIAPNFPPSTFIEAGLLPYISSWGFIFAVAAFFVGLVALVLIMGRAGWWAYVLGGFLVGALTWAAAVVGYALSRETFDIVITGMEPIEVVSFIGLTLPALFAGIVAREATVWFGAWIGNRGRKITAKNRAALAEYNAAAGEYTAA